MSRAVSRLVRGRRYSVCPAYDGGATSAAAGTFSDQLLSFKDIPGPKCYPLIGSLLDYVTGDVPVNQLFRMVEKRFRDYGPVYKETILGTTIVVVSDYPEFQKVMRADGKYPIRGTLNALSYYNRLNNYGDPIGHGKSWSEWRSKFNKKMLRPLEVEQFLGKMDDVAMDTVKTIAKLRDFKGLVSDVNELAYRWSVEALSCFLLNKRVDLLSYGVTSGVREYVEDCRQAVRVATKMDLGPPIYKYVSTPAWRKLKKHFDSSIIFGRPHVEQRLEDYKTGRVDPSEDNSLLAYLLANKKSTNEEISFALSGLMLAAVDTTPNTLLWLLYSLAANPDKQEKLYQEVSSVLGGDDHMSVEQLRGMPYLRACLKESMRLHPITLFIPRILSTDVEVGGYMVPKGTRVLANTYSMFKNPDVFAQPDRFVPERWLGQRQERADMAVVDLAWGYGVRMCLGRRLATQELLTTIARLMQNYRITYPETKPPKPIIELLIEPEEALRLKFHDRRPADSH